MQTMIKRDPITGLYESYPIPSAEDKNSNIQPQENSVKCAIKDTGIPVPRGKT